MKKTKENGITLISLIITIIILLIIAGIAIGQLVESGLFDNAKLAADKQIKAQVVEEITLKIIDIQMEDTKNNKKTTFKSLHDNLPIKSTKIEMDDYEEGDDQLTGVYDTGKSQYEFIIDDKFNVILGNIVKEKRKKFDIEISDIDETSFIVSAKQEDLSDMQVEKYTYIIEGEGSNQEIKDRTESTKKIEGLQSGKQYTVKMIAYDNQENARESKTKIVKTLINVESIKGAIVITPSTEEWTNQDIEVVVEWGESNSGFKKEISIDGGSTYKEYTGPVQIKNNTKVIAKITVDGTEITEELLITNIDKLKPNNFEHQILSDLISDTELQIIATTTDKDKTEQDGKSDIQGYIYYVYEDGEEKIKSELINQTSWNATGLEPGVTYEILVEAYDNAGNKSVSEGREYTKLNVYTWNKYSKVQTYIYYVANNNMTITFNNTGFYPRITNIVTCFNSTYGRWVSDGYTIGGWLRR